MMGGYWIPENRSTRIPRAHICLDSEAVVTESPGGEVHTFRVAVTSLDKRSRKSDDWLPTLIAVHEDLEALWDWVTVHTKPKERTVLVAHNLGYDLRVCDAFTRLPARGWVLEHFSLAPGATWLTWKRAGATLQMVDSMTWLPTSLANIGTAIGRRKASLPRTTDHNELWVDRCTQDVVILRDAWLRIIEWLRAEDLGNFRPTGAGQSWSAWRHKHLTHKVLVHDNELVKTVERRAVWTGRAEAWRFGRQTQGPFTEWDFSCAYARIAQRCSVPTRLIGEMSNASVAKVSRSIKSYGVLVDCEVSTSEPVVPTEKDGRIVWPVGRFDTTIWDNEYELALRHGAELRVKRAWVYERAPALRQWADWVLERVEAAPGGVDPVVRAVCKHWCRALIGRFGTRFSEWEALGDALGVGASLRDVAHVGDVAKGQELEVGGLSWSSGAMVDHRLAAPQVMGWIVAQCRVDLWEAMNASGLSNVLYVDTDSLIVTPGGDRRLSELGLPGLRRKSRYQSLDIVGTRRLVQDRQLKAAGVPRESVRVSRRVWSGEAWESLSGSLKSGSAGEVRVVERRTVLRDRDTRRRRLPGGASEAWTIHDGDA